eukprot:1308672-Heterocapsa_arctica.AAC.1
MESRELDSKHGRRVLEIDQTTGLERGVDEATTRKFYQKLAQNDPMTAGAMRTILADGVWTPRRAHK